VIIFSAIVHMFFLQEYKQFFLQEHKQCNNPYREAPQQLSSNAVEVIDWKFGHKFL